MNDTRPARAPSGALLLLLALGVAPGLGVGATHAQGPLHPDSIRTAAADAPQARLLPTGPEWAIAGGLLAASAAVDLPLRRVLGGPSTPLADVGNALGNAHYVVPVTGLTWAVGWLSGHERLERVGRDATVGLAAAGVVNGLLKYGIGRARPAVRVGEALSDGTDLRAGSLVDSWQAFPSGHAVVAFSVATTIAEEVDEPWAAVVAYGGAAFVGWSRLEHRRHWASDVVGGAVVGIFATRAARRWLRARDGEAGLASGPRIRIGPGELAIVVPY